MDLTGDNLSLNQSKQIKGQIQDKLCFVKLLYIRAVMLLIFQYLYFFLVLFFQEVILSSTGNTSRLYHIILHVKEAG